MLKIGQISDIHIGENKGPVLGIDTRNNFMYALKSILAKNPDFLVLSGDLAYNNGEPGAYKFIAEQIKDLKCPVFIIPGNHDNIETMSKFFDLPVKNGKCYYRHDADDKTFFFLDSACGDLSKDQLDWFENEMKTVNGEAYVFMHHPPCLCDHKFMDSFCLKNIEEAQSVFSKYKNLNHVFCGHYHNACQKQFSHVSVHVAPAIQMQIGSNYSYFKMQSTRPGWQFINIDSIVKVIISY